MSTTTKTGNKKPSFFQVPLFPFLFAIYAVIGLWSVNLGQASFVSIIRSLVAALVVSIVVFGLCLLLFRDKNRSALLSGSILFLFFYFGHFSNLLAKITLFGMDLNRYRYPILLAFIIFVVSIFVIIKIKKPEKVVVFANLICLLLLAISLIQIIRFESQSYSAKPDGTSVALERDQTDQSNSENLPDVYYIVLDSYGRQDELKTDFDIDNSIFINTLNQLGFVIPPCTHSNYQFTETSLTSSLNMNYLSALNIPIDKISDQNSAIKFSSLISNSLIRKEFESLGYQFISFKSAYPFVDIPNSDIYYDVEMDTPFTLSQESINFYNLFLRTTIMRVLMDAQDSHPENFDFLPDWVVQLINPKNSLFTSSLYKQYQQNLYSLDELANIPQLPGNKFIYAHLFLTHPPYTFNLDGSFRQNEVITSGEDYVAYRENVIYATQRYTDLIQKIIEKSPTPPIIILQGDHSYPENGNRTRILNAYFLPGDGNKQVYPTITPVNTFRLVLDYYFDRNYELLPDQSYGPDNITMMAIETQANDCFIPTP